MPVLLIAASGSSLGETLPVLRETNRQVLGLLDDRHADLPPTIGGVPLLGGIGDVRRYDDAELLVCVGWGPGRERLVSRLRDLGVDDARYATVIDPSVRNPGNSPIGAGSISVGRRNDHGRRPRWGATSSLCRGSSSRMTVGSMTTRPSPPASRLAALCRIGSGAYLGMNASVRQRVYDWGRGDGRHGRRGPVRYFRPSNMGRCARPATEYRNEMNILIAFRSAPLPAHFAATEPNK